MLCFLGNKQTKTKQQITIEQALCTVYSLDSEERVSQTALKDKKGEKRFLRVPTKRNNVHNVAEWGGGGGVGGSEQCESNTFIEGRRGNGAGNK